MGILVFCSNLMKNDAVVVGLLMNSWLIVVVVVGLLMNSWLIVVMRCDVDELMSRVFIIMDLWCNLSCC